MCQAEPIIDRETIEMHLEQIKTLVSTWAAQVSVFTCRSEVFQYFTPSDFSSFFFSPQPCFAEVVFPESNFVDQIELLLKDPEEKERFFQVCDLFMFKYHSFCWRKHFFIRCYCVFLQDVFPTDFGPDYDGALQVLMLDFLSRLEKLLPVPDIQQVLEPVSLSYPTCFFFINNEV